MKRFAEDMDRLFEDFEVHHGARMPRLLRQGLELFQREAGLVPVDWSPQIEVKERDDKFIVRADLPGMSRKRVKVEVRDGLLTIQGERRQDAKKEHTGRDYSECIYDAFSRLIPLPDGIDPACPEADGTDRPPQLRPFVIREGQWTFGRPTRDGVPEFGNAGKPPAMG